ncbi:Oxidoreductase, aldo/keto reductase family protein [Hyella patelloides LEGE 07179]|uniref:Oxidoreductase, aldo/keto reductase family protein n=1 Tax=Hyella patelloides LEGE 07179 TaxID=945734 RepID=A0A563VJI7_9CYAN|nr:aldo/keto reductase [Hyella patelloides]VEP11475.1 Oxidoreductase, aldo/keto reductase family protein [Hyella patelloides LEGE 07179]
MLYREFGKTGMNVSTIGMGTWNISNQWGKVDEETALATVRAAVDSGINLFDTAESYGVPNGLSEERLGKALQGIRDRVHLVTKIGRWGRRTGQMVPMTTVDMVRLCTFACLFRLKTDWVDIMLCHEGKIEDPSVYLEGFEQLKEQGYIRAYGISTDRLDVLKRFNANNTCSVVEVEYSLLNRAPESEFLPYCQEHDIAVLVRGPLGKGLLSGKYAPGTVFTDSVRSEWYADDKKKAKLERKLAKVEKLKSVMQPGEEMVTAAIHYVTSHPVQPVAIPGAKSPAQAIVNAKAGDALLSEEKRQELVRLTKTEKTAVAG